MISAFNLSAEEKIISLGGKDGWPKLARMKNVTDGTGKFGYQCIELKTNSRETDEFTDLYLDFESINSSSSDVTGNYTVSGNSITQTPLTVRGKAAGISIGNGGLKLKGKPGTLFGTTGNAGSFTIEFWLCPSTAENGEIVFYWRSSRTIADYSLYQMITAGFFNNHMEWSFVNLFNGYTQDNCDVTLTSYRSIIPDVWCFHSISYNDETGLLEYRIDGQLEALKFVTSNGKESGGSIFNPQFGVTADIEICSQYTGSIDDFRIERKAVDYFGSGITYDRYSSEGGRFETMPVMVSAGAVLTSIDAVVNEPEQTAVNFYVRSGDNVYGWSDNYPEWKPVSEGEKISDVQGLYFQVAAELLADGGGTKTPSVTELKLHVQEVPLPLPPFSVQATPGDGQVTLLWSYSVDDTTGGYYVYYGERPGEYLGKEAVQGFSPLNAGSLNNITLTGLKNGKIYYFAIASFSRSDNTIQGPLSKEVYARPVKR